MNKNSTSRGFFKVILTKYIIYGLIFYNIFRSFWLHAPYFPSLSFEQNRAETLEPRQLKQIQQPSL